MDSGCLGKLKSACQSCVYVRSPSSHMLAIHVPASTKSLAWLHSGEVDSHLPPSCSKIKVAKLHLPLKTAMFPVTA